MHAGEPAECPSHSRPRSRRRRALVQTGEAEQTATEPEHEQQEAQHEQSRAHKVAIAIVRDGHSQIAEKVPRERVARRRCPIEERPAWVPEHRGGRQDDCTTYRITSSLEQGHGQLYPLSAVSGVSPKSLT